MPKGKRIANFSWDARGWARLRQHVASEIWAGHLDKDLIELNLTGSRVKSYSDLQHLQQIVKSFHDVCGISLRGCGLQVIEFLAELLCTKFLSCRRVDLADNDLSKEAIQAFIDALQGRAFTKEVKAFYLALGVGHEEFLSPASSGCGPYTGCKCSAGKVVHIITSMSAQPSTTQAAVEKSPPGLPPPPSDPPPKPLMDTIMDKCAAFGRAGEQLTEAIGMERARGHTIRLNADTEYVLMTTHKGKFSLLDLLSIDPARTVADHVGMRFHLDDVASPGDSDAILVSAHAEPFAVERCATPESYMRTRGGETIYFRLASCDDGWVAARPAASEDKWLWFPFAKCGRP